jgi:hypothetical protein
MFIIIIIYQKYHLTPQLQVEVSEHVGCLPRQCGCDVLPRVGNVLAEEGLGHGRETGVQRMVGVLAEDLPQGHPLIVFGVIAARGMSGGRERERPRALQVALQFGTSVRLVCSCFSETATLKDGLCCYSPR